MLREALSLAFVVAVVVVLRTFVFGIYHVPGDAMRPTLLPGDSILVDRLAYGLAAPFGGAPWASWSAPARGDVIVFREPGGSGVLVKRVVGVGGDRVEIRSGRVRVNGRPLEEFELTDADAYARAEVSPSVARLARESGEGFPGHRVMHPRAGTDAPLDASEFVVPPGRVFCLGDDRGDAPSSRFWGFVDASRLVGRATRVAYSVRPEGAAGGPAGMRWDRTLWRIE